MAWRAAAVSGRHEPGSRVMLSARYRRAVAEAFVWLQGNGNGQGVEPVIDLCGDDGADPAADGDGSGTFFSARQVGAWIRTHASDTLTDRWDWYDRVTRALSGLVLDGFVCVGPGVGGLFRLGDTAEGRRVTTLLTLRWKDKEDMALEVSSSCTDLKLREIVSRKTGGRLPAVKIELTYPGLFDKKRDTMGALSDDTVVTLLIGKDLTQKPKTQRTPSASIVADPNASPIDEVFEHEAEGTKGWNDNNDGWVNLVVNENGEESDDEDDEDGEFTLTRSSGGAKKMSAKKPAATARFAETNTSRAEVDCSKLLATVGTRGGKAPNTSAPAPATALAVFDDNGDDDELSPKSKLFSPVAAARAFRLNNDDDELDEDLGERPRKRGRSSTPAKNGVVDLTGEDDSRITQENDRSASDSALSGSENSDSDSDSDESLDDHAGRLHDQILTFAELNGSDRDDGIRRELCRKTVQACVQRVFPSASLEVFGSGASGLALREADIDLVILGVGPTAATAGGGFNKHDRQELVSILRKIEKQLRKDRVVVRALGVYTAKVPIVKAHTTGNDNSGFNLDLTVGATNGLKAVRWIKQQVVEFPELRPLVLVVKKLLKTHGLDDASTGGCGGYLLVSLAVAHLKMNKQGTGGLGNTPTAQKGGTPTVDQKAPQTTDLGFVLTSFLRRFGGDGFDFAKSAVAANRSAGLMRASEVVVTVGPYGKRPFILCEDPQEVGRYVLGLSQIQTHCLAIHKKLTAFREHSQKHHRFGVPFQRGPQFVPRHRRGYRHGGRPHVSARSRGEGGGSWGWDG